MTDLNAREAYRLWAPTYTSETAISFIDEQLTRLLSPPAKDKRLLDAGCGTGRRLPRESTLAVGVDSCREMLAAGGATAVAAADIRALPFAAGQFDIVWCRLVLGHLADPMAAYHEFGRVCRSGGYLLVTDFHPDAVAAGHKRRLCGTGGTLHDIEHFVHDAARHEAMAARAGFTLSARRNGMIGPAVEAFYLSAGRSAAYRRDLGLAVVASFLFRRPGQCGS